MVTADDPGTRRRILFVDDEPDVLAALRNGMWRDRQRWEMVFATGAEDALVALHQAPFDAVVSDMRMPGIDGATLMTVIKRESPTTVRIMLTGHADPEAIARVTPVLHQLLSKPCNAATLRAAIEKNLASRST